jgi:hypothetical protein
MFEHHSVVRAVNPHMNPERSGICFIPFDSLCLLPASIDPSSTDG